MKRRVVVTGIGAVTSLGCKVDELWTRVCNGESGIGPLERFDIVELPRPLRRRNPQLVGRRLHRGQGHQALRSLCPVRPGRRGRRGARFGHRLRQVRILWRCGVILGSGIGGLETIEVQHRRLLEKGPDKVSAFTIPKLIGNAASAQVSIQYGLRGPNQAVATACAAPPTPSATPTSSSATTRPT